VACPSRRRGHGATNLSQGMAAPALGHGTLQGDSTRRFKANGTLAYRPTRSTSAAVPGLQSRRLLAVQRRVAVVYRATPFTGFPGRRRAVGQPF
jgi:hypothetical protein